MGSHHHSRHRSGDKGLSKILFTLLILCGLPTFSQGRLQVWRFEGDRFLASQNAHLDEPMPVGSLQKPFVAKAWAQSHPGELSPRFRCLPGECWLKKGHGELGLTRALALSCNAYFRQLAQATDLKILARALEAEGFQGRVQNPEAAIGLPTDEALLRIRPSTLLAAYHRLIWTPWDRGEEIRRQLILGMREAVTLGTAQALKTRGVECLAKTGTVPSPDGNPMFTCGLALAMEGRERAFLARLEPGTGREAARALLSKISAASQGPSQDLTQNTETKHSVRVRLFDLLKFHRIQIRNLQSEPIACKAGFLGPGGSRELHPGEWIGPGLLELQLPERNLIRMIQGRVFCESGRDRTLAITASIDRREYVNGVLLAELPEGSRELRMELGAAALRFLARGPRHPDVDVCDSTHCAWFIGRGPHLDWNNPTQAIVGKRPSTRNSAQLMTSQEWETIQGKANQVGPWLWTAHCGGHPLAPFTLWGKGEPKPKSCPRHSTSTQSWKRQWPRKALERAFGPVLDLGIETQEGIWGLRVKGPQGSKVYCYDEAHRRLAEGLGWDALPSPAEHVETVPEGFEVQGFGQGHRVGLCLGD